MKKFEHVILHDGSTLTVHPKLASVFKGRFTKTAPAAVECHVSLSLFERKIIRMDIDADCVSKHRYLPEPYPLKNSLLFTDSGDVNKPYFHQLDENNASYTVKGKVTQKQNPQTIMDFDVEWKDYRCRLIRCWVPSEEKFITWLTNLPRNEFNNRGEFSGHKKMRLPLQS